MAKKINFKYYFTLCFITSYIIFITILTLKAIPNKNSNNDLEGELLKRDDISYDLNDIYNSEEKSKYYKPDDYGKNIVNGQFAFIHIIWASIASGFRAMYSISKNDLIRISESDFKNPSGIVQTALNTKGLVLLFVVLALFAVFALLLNIVCFPLYICINICTKTRYTTKNYKKSKILCGRIFFGIFSFLLTFSPLFALMGYQSISNSVDTITKGSKTLIYDIDEFVINAEDVIKNKATNIVIDTVRAEVVDPIKYEIDIKIIQNATVMYDKALDTINEVIPFINEVKNIVYEDGYPVINKLYNLIQELEVDYNQDLSKLETDVFEKNTTLNDVLNTLNEFESVMSDTKQTLDDNNIHEIYNKALNTIDDAFKMVDEFTSEFTNIDLSDIRTILHDDVYNTINDIEGYKSDIDIFSPNLFYKTLFLIITLLSVIVILFAILRLHKGVKTLLITCIPIGAIFWIITIIFLLISVLVSQTCNTIYELDSETVATIYKKVETIYGNIEQKENDEILNSLSNYNFKFETFSKLIYSCASDKNNDTSIWSVLEKEEFNSLIKTTCSIIEENIQLEEIKIECSEVNGRDDLIKSFVKAINITGKISEEVDKIDISEILSGITDIPEIPTEIEIPEISIESLKSSLNEITSNIDTICLGLTYKNGFKPPSACTEEKKEEKKIYYNSQVEDINNRVNKLDQKLQSKKDDMENKLIPNIEKISDELKEFLNNIGETAQNIIDSSINSIKAKEFSLFSSIIDKTFSLATKCQSWSQDIWILSNSVCHGIPNGIDVIWWSSVIIAFLLTFNIFGGIQLMTYTVAALKYDGKDVESDKKSRPDKKVSINEKQSGKSRSDACTSEGLPPQKDVLKTNVLDDFNNISKYNVELDDENVDKKRNDLNKEVLKKHESMITPSKELNELLENGPKSNYHPDPIFNNNEDEIKEVEDSDDDIDNERVEIEVINDDDDEVVEIDVVNDNDDIVEIDVTNNDNNDNDDNLYQ